jgi:MFS family permease
MHVDDPSTPAPTPPISGPWYRELNRYHWYVFVVAALGWLFDCMDQRIFMVSRQTALTELLGYRYEQGTLLALEPPRPLKRDELQAAAEDLKSLGLKQTEGRLLTAEGQPLSDQKLQDALNKLLKLEYLFNEGQLLVLQFRALNSVEQATQATRLKELGFQLRDGILANGDGQPLDEKDLPAAQKKLMAAGYYLHDRGLAKQDGSLLTRKERIAASNDIAWYSGLATAIFMIGWATGGLLFGIMGDRWGRARTMLLTILIYSMFTGLTALSTSWWDFMLYRFLTGMGVGGEFAAGVALLAEVMPARARPYALGSLQALSAVGNITGSLLSWGFGWRALFVVGIVPAFMVVLVRRGLKEPESWQKARAEQAATPSHQADMGSLGEMLGHPRWRYHTIIGVLLALAGVIGLWGVGFWTFELVRLALREQGGYSDTDLRRVVAWGTALQDVGACLGMLVFSAVAARMGRRIAFAGAFLLALGATLFVFGTLSKESDVYWMLPLLGFCNLMVFGGYAIYFPELYPTRLRSTGTGFCYNVARYIAAVGPFVLPAFIAAYTRMLGVEAGDPTPFRYATMTIAGIYVLGLLTLPFAPETRGKALPE